MENSFVFSYIVSRKPISRTVTTIDFEFVLEILVSKGFPDFRK